MTQNTLRESVRLHDSGTPALLAGPDLLIGLAAGDRPVTLPADTGHVLVATGAGSGTTTVLRALATQALARGARTDILDLTGVEHTWAKGVPRARYLSGIAEIHDYLVLAATGLNNGARGGPGVGWGERHVLVVEELARLADELRRYWMRTRPETQLEEAPGVDALALLLASGRPYGWTVLAGDTGGSIPGPGPLHHQHFPTRILGTGNRILWRRLAPGLEPPTYATAVGRFHLVDGPTSTPLQALYLSGADARTIATVESGQRECA